MNAAGVIQQRAQFRIFSCALLCIFQLGCAVCGHYDYGYTVEGELAYDSADIGDLRFLRFVLKRDGVTIVQDVMEFSTETTNGRFQLLLPEKTCDRCAILGIFRSSFECGETLTVPNEIEIRAVYRQCEQSISITFSTETVTDLSFPEEVITLRDPVVIHRCD